MKFNSFRGFTAACLATTAVIGVVAPAFAQIEEIIVTTRKRSENLQEIPIVVTAFTAENIERKGIANIGDILKYTAGVQINEAFIPGDQRIVIRGLAPTRGRPNVAVLQDDIDISSESIQNGGGSLLINPRLFDLERVEIVKGPHSALYGRSAFAGALNYITRKPGQEFEGRASADVGAYGKYEAKASISGPMIADKLSVGVNAAYWHFGGFWNNTVTNEKLGGNQGKGVGSTLIFRATDTLKVTLRGEYTNDTAEPTPRAVVSTNLNEVVPLSARTEVSPALGGTPTTRPGFVVSSLLTTFPIVDGPIPDVRSGRLFVNISPDPRTGKDYEGVSRKIFRTTLRIDEEMSFADLTSLTHYGHSHGDQFLELANVGNVNTSKVAQEVNYKTETKLFSEELRLQSNDDSAALKWTVGGLYWNEDANQLSASLTCFTSFPSVLQAGPTILTIPGGNPADNCGTYVKAVGTTLPSNPENWGRNTFHSSTYFLADYNITDALSVSFEGRQTWEHEHTKGPVYTHAIDPYGIISPGPSPIGCTPAAGQLIATQCLTRGSGVLGPDTRSIATIGDQKNQNFFIPRAGLNYKVNEDILVYASASKAEKPGGISTLGGGNGGYNRDLLEYAPEKMKVYEAGWKSTLLDGKALFNASFYYQDYTDKQTSSQIVLANGILGTRIVNAAAARVKGVDLETVFQPNKELNFTVGYTYNDAKYKKFIVRTTGANSLVRSQSCIPVVTYRLLDGSSTTVSNPTALPAAGAVITGRSCDIDKSGHKLEFAPTHSLTGNVLYKADLGNDLSWVSELSVQAQSKRYADDDQRSFLQGFWTADIRTGIESADWSVTAYANNVFNDDTIKGGLANTDFPNLRAIISPGPFTLVLPSNYTGNMPDKRMLGVRASYKF